MKTTTLKSGVIRKLVLPSNNMKPTKVYVDYVLKNPVSDEIEYTLIVCRVWNKRKKYFIFHTYELYHIQMYNEELNIKVRL